jgi:uncharacterized protein
MTPAPSGGKGTPPARASGGKPAPAEKKGPEPFNNPFRNLKR